LKLIIGKVFDGNYIIEKAFYLIKDGRLFNCFEAEALTSGVFQKALLRLKVLGRRYPFGIFILDIEISTGRQLIK
jgi:hypothetical protein